MPRDNETPSIPATLPTGQTVIIILYYNYKIVGLALTLTLHCLHLMLSLRCHFIVSITSILLFI